MYKIGKITSLLIVAFTLLFTSCVEQQSNVTTTQENFKGKKPKYIFYFIGDGMGISQTIAAEQYLSAKGDKARKLHMNTLPVQGVYTTYAEDRFITGSAAAGTALATGEKTTINTISKNGDRTKALKTIAEDARDLGMKVGIISSVSIDHATPASFYAHQDTRSMYYPISLDLSKSNFNYFAGGGIKHPKGDGKKRSSKGNTGLGKDNVKDNKENSIELAKKRGYTYLDTKDGFDNLKKGDDKIITVAPILVGGKSLPYGIDKTPNNISLSEFTAKGIELLDNPKGFFMMVEGGKIDWSCHANDAATSIIEVIEFDNAIKVALDFYKKHPDETLIVVCGDHETGGLTMGFAGTHYSSNFEVLHHQKVSSERFSNIVKTYKKEKGKKANFKEMSTIIKKHYGLGDAEKDLELSKYDISKLKKAFAMSMMDRKERKYDEATYLLYGSYDPLTVTLTHMMAQKAGISWTTFSHTGTPIVVKTLGAGQNLFTGYFDNTDIAKNIRFLMNHKK